jgi:hypothetical protein
MKRQGKYGFTFDSKAEEWLHWALSCSDHNPARTGKEDAMQRGMVAIYLDDWLCDKPELTPQRMGSIAAAWADRATRPAPYAELDAVCTQIARPVPLWPFAAIAAVAATLVMVIASVEGWI